MHARILDGFCIFTDRGEQKGPFYLVFEKECALYINGNAVEGGKKKTAFRISPQDLLEGENILSVNEDGARLPCQSLYRHGALVKPLGFPTEKTVLSLLHRLDELALRLEKAEAKISLLSERCLGASLFDI